MNKFSPSTPYNPLDKEKLGESVANALLASPSTPLPPEPFEGAGVYALYYRGAFPAYSVLSGSEIPIYIGKAVPEGARKGHRSLDSARSTCLFERLRQHAKSMDQVALHLTNFTCRHLVVDDIWIPLGESLLIRRFKPVWNVLLEGFGNHDPGGKRKEGYASRWDTVHPGRPWVSRRNLQPNPKPKEAWIEEIKRYLATGEASDLVMEEPTPYDSSDQA